MFAGIPRVNLKDTSSFLPVAAGLFALSIKNQNRELVGEVDYMRINVTGSISPFQFIF